MIFLDFLLNLLLFKLRKRAICVKKIYPSSHTPLRQLADFPSLIYPLSIPYLSLIYPLSIPYLPLIYPLSTPYLSLILRHILGCASSPTFLRLSIPYLSLIYPLSIAYPSSHTRLCQLADFPSLIYPLSIPYLPLIYRLSFVTYSAVPARRLSFAYPSLKVRSSFAEGSVRNNYEF